MYINPKVAPRSTRSATVSDWSKLSHGDVVRVLRRDGSTATGLIDMLALDRSVLWVVQDGGRGGS